MTSKEIMEILKGIKCLHQLEYSSKHFKVINEPWMLYVDNIISYIQATPKIYIMRWDRKDRPKRTFEEMFNSVSPQTRNELVYYLDLFNEYSGR